MIFQTPGEFFGSYGVEGRCYAISFKPIRFVMVKIKPDLLVMVKINNWMFFYSQKISPSFNTTRLYLKTVVSPEKLVCITGFFYLI
jgi:hypothetical protein